MSTRRGRTGWRWSAGRAASVLAWAASIGPMVVYPARAQGQDLTSLTVAEFRQMESEHRYAIAGMYVGVLATASEIIRQQEPDGVGRIADCIAQWQEQQPDTYVGVLADTWIDMIEIGALGASLADSTTAANTGSQALTVLFDGFLLLSCQP